MLGSNRDEYKFFLWSSPRFSDRRFGLLPTLKNHGDYERVTSYFSNQWQAVGVDEPARILGRSQPGRVFTYRFDWSNQATKLGVDMSELFGAAHGIEVAFLFGRDEVSSLPMFAIPDKPDDAEALGRAMRAYWTEFARTGSPGKGGDTSLPEWHAWAIEGDKKLLLDTADEGGIRMSSATVSAEQLKQRLRNDQKITNTRERCELYAQLFYYALSSDFWSIEEFKQLGCAEFKPEDFDGII